MRLFFVTTFLILILGLDVAAQSANEIWDEANEAYNAGKYEVALSAYRRILDEGVQSATLFHNLGNAYYRVGDLGHAVLNYEKALLISPGHKGSLHNLELIFDQQEDPIIPVESFFLSRWWQNTYRFLSPGTWAVLSIVFMILAGTGIYFLLYRNISEKKKIWEAGVLTVGFLTILCILCGYQHSRFVFQNPYAIVIDSNVELHDGADERSEAVKKLYPGAKVLVFDQIENWLKVSTMDKEHGWIEESSIKKIAIHKS